MIATLRTLFRASVAEAEDVLVDANGTRLLAQHLRDAGADTQRARRMLAGLIARQKAEERRIEKLTNEIAAREEQTRAALAAGQEDLAGDLADHIARLEDERDTATRARDDLDQRCHTLRARLSEADRRIAQLAAELRAARAGEICRKARTCTDEALGPNALERAEAMAFRVRESADRLEDQLCAMGDIARSTGEDLNARLRDAGLDDAKARRSAILDRIRTTN